MTTVKKWIAVYESGDVVAIADDKEGIQRAVRMWSKTGLRLVLADITYK